MFELRHQRTRHPHPGRTHPRPTPRLPTHRRAHPDHHHLNPNGAAVDRTNLTPSNKPAGHRHFPPPRPTQVRLNDRLSAVADRSAQVTGATGGHGLRVEPDSYVTRLICRDNRLLARILPGSAWLAWGDGPAVGGMGSADARLPPSGWSSDGSVALGV